jgi:hypothetical protein
MALSEVSNRSPQQIWEWVLSTLQTDMSRAAYETWVKPAEVVSFDADIFTIGCHNDYARQWLESRLKKTIEHMLSGFVGQPVEVKFDLLSNTISHPENVESDDAELGKEDCEDTESLRLQPVHASLRDALIEPDRVVKMPVYFLRWLPIIGARTLFEVIGLWQEYYLTSKGKQPKGGEKVSTRVERTCQWSGVSRAQFFRDLQPGGPLSWFAHKIETDHEADRRTGRSKKSANKYALHGIPMTPGDSEDLANYLVTHGIKNNPYETLREAVEVQPNQILSFPVRLPSDIAVNIIPRPVSVQAVIRDAVGHRLDEELSDLADRLADRLLAPSDFILIRWYFLQNWLPLLGHHAAMFLILLRNMCYFNDETGEIREDVWIDGGYSTIAARLGIDNPRLIAHWFPSVLERGNHKGEHSASTSEEVTRRERIQELLGMFVQRLEFRQNGREAFNWHFKVQRSDSLIPEHETIKHAAVELLARADDEEVLGDLYDFLDWLPNDCFETLKKDPMIVLRLSKISNDCLETLGSILNDCFETVKPLSNDCFETLLKILKGFKDSYKAVNTSSTQDSLNLENSSQDRLVVGVSENGKWCLEKILTRANPEIRKTILECEKSPIPFVSWILYGAASSNIQNPLSLAISKIKEQPGQDAGGAFERLARLEPAALANNLRLELTLRSPSGKDWQSVFHGVSHDRLRLLADIFDIQFDQGEC